MSPERFIREKARSFPIDKCYVSDGWKENGMGWVIVTRRRKSGNLIAGVFLIDFYCLGVKDGMYFNNITQADFNKRFFDNTEMKFSEITYPEAHNMILGAVEFAEEAGLAPCKEFSTLQYILEPDTDNIPLIEYEYGKDGKYLLVCYPGSTDKLFIPRLQKRLGDNFNYIVPVDDTYDDDDDDDYYDDNADFPDEPYSYEHHKYAVDESLIDPRVMEIFDNLDDCFILSDSDIDAFLALPREVLSASLINIIYMQLNELYDQYLSVGEDEIDDHDFSIMTNAVLILGEVPSEEAAAAVCETLTLPPDLLDIVYADILTEYMPIVIEKLAPSASSTIAEYISVPGIYSFARNALSQGLMMAADAYPDLRPDLIGLLKPVVDELSWRIPELNAADATYGALVVSEIFDYRLSELYDIAKRVIATDILNPSIIDKDTIENILNDTCSAENVYPKSLKDFYKRMKSWGKQ